LAEERKEPKITQQEILVRWRERYPNHTIFESADGGREAFRKAFARSRKGRKIRPDKNRAR
jgi:hypothetical protein